MSGFVLKIIACICMFIGHIPYVFPNTVIPCILIGRISFPIFAFLISEGYIHTKNFRKYLTRLLVLAVISQLPASLLFNPNFSSWYLNIFFTLAIGLLSIRFFDKIKNKFLAVIPILILAYIAEFLGCDFGAIGVFIIVCFYAFKNNRNLMVLVEAFLMIVFFAMKLSYYTSLSITIIRYILLQLLFTICSLIFIIFYNSKRGKDNRKIQISFYLFYPIHLVFLCVIKYLVV